MPRQAQKGDRYVGDQIRSARIVSGKSQSDLGAHLGVSFQQVQKYEKGVNRVSSIALIKIAEFLNVEPLSLLPASGSGKLPKEREELLAFMATTDGVALARAFSKLPRGSIRKTVITLIEQFHA